LWLLAAAHSDLHFTQRQQRGLMAIFGQDLFGMATIAWVKTPRVLASICKSKRPSKGRMDKSALG
jgi:hypothetical protein